MRAIYRRALDLGDVAVSPCDGLRLPAEQGRRERIATPTEAAALIAALPERQRPLWATAFYTGLRAKAGLTSINPHECRHTYASLMIAAGVNAKALSTYMGHASIKITLDRYGKLMPGNEAEAAQLLDAYIDRSVAG
ncbi:MAG TPA: tyrosine-type recombinase/integrase [Thermoleophilaceae bacterium]|nr:tyrosine-type recombinase/integrase [Thermoleophilaceae bacterium]